MCEWLSMRPGVTNFPEPSITMASAGASTVAPTPAIFPSRKRIAPFTTRGPTAVNIVTFRITVGRDGSGVYVLGNGSASGDESAPDPAPPCALVSGAGVLGVVGVRAAVLPEAQAAVAMSTRMANRVTSEDLRLWVGYARE